MDTKRVKLNPKTGCHEWQGTKADKGYAILIQDGRPVRLSRLIHHIYKGKLKPDQLAMHTCDNPSCVNPEHIIAGSPRDNVNDMVAKGRHARGERNASVRLSSKDVLEIRASPMRGVNLAPMYGVSVATISKIRTGKLWRHLLPESKSPSC